MEPKSIRMTLCGFFASSALACAAALEPVYPTGGETVPLVPDAQKKVMSLPTLAERIQLLKDDRDAGGKLCGSKSWRKASPLVLKWRATNGERGPWKVEIAASSDFSDAHVWYERTAEVDAATGRDKEGGGEAAQSAVVSYTVPCANLEVGREYFWRVVARSRCGKFNCGPKCGCEESKKVERSEVASFRTEDLAPRWIAIYGNVGNMRDCGGWRAAGGRRVRQGMIFRGQGLNDNSITGETQGRNRLTVEDTKYLTRGLGIRTDLDLRSHGETADLDESPLGSGVKFVLRPSYCYRDVFSDKGKKIMAENFREFCDRANYPVYVHCIGGADRTGSLCYMLLGVLGVDRHDMEVDWESTFYPRIPDENPDPKFWCRESHFNNGLSKYGEEGDSWSRRVELYLLDCGVTKEEIAAFRSIMLE